MHLGWPMERHLGWLKGKQLVRLLGKHLGWLKGKQKGKHLGWQMD
jgi:hypothetical protein